MDDQNDNHTLYSSETSDDESFNPNLEDLFLNYPSAEVDHRKKYQINHSISIQPSSDLQPLNFGFTDYFSTGNSNRQEETDLQRLDRFCMSYFESDDLRNEREEKVLTIVHEDKTTEDPTERSQTSFLDGKSPEDPAEMSPTSFLDEKSPKIEGNISKSRKSKGTISSSLQPNCCPQTLSSDILQDTDNLLTGNADHQEETDLQRLDRFCISYFESDDPSPKEDQISPVMLEVQTNEEPKEKFTTSFEEDKKRESKRKNSKSDPRETKKILKSTNNERSSIFSDRRSNLWHCPFVMVPNHLKLCRSASRLVQSLCTLHNLQQRLMHWLQQEENQHLSPFEMTEESVKNLKDQDLEKRPPIKDTKVELLELNGFSRKRYGYSSVKTNFCRDPQSENSSLPNTKKDSDHASVADIVLNVIKMLEQVFKPFPHNAFFLQYMNHILSSHIHLQQCTMTCESQTSKRRLCKISNPKQMSERSLERRLDRRARRLLKRIQRLDETRLQRNQCKKISFARKSERKCRKVLRTKHKLEQPRKPVSANDSSSSSSFNSTDD